VPSAIKDGKDLLKDRIFLEDKVHVPIPNRGGPFQKKPEGTSAFRAASNIGVKDSGSLNISSNLAQASSVQRVGKPEPEVYCGGKPREQAKEPMLKIELNLFPDEGNEKPSNQEIDLKVEDDDDDDDDEDLFGEKPKSPPKAKAVKEEVFLDKRSESDHSDDEDLFDDAAPAPSKKLVTGPNPTAAQGHDTARPTAGGQPTEMDQRIEVALKKDIPIKAEEVEQKKNIVEDDEEQLNSDDDISDYNEVLETGDNILLGYYVKVG
jgi:hypothetical protein